MNKACPLIRQARAMLLATVAFATLGSAELMAQRFQWIYGKPTCREAGRGGVRQLSGGGYIAVGETYSSSTCLNSHIYVVVTNPDGSLLWTNDYYIGQNDSATDVVEMTTGEFAICGVTEKPKGCTSSRDAFILKLFPSGGVSAVGTYGFGSTDEIAWGICEANFGTAPASPGDLIIAGSAVPQPGGPLNGYIVRVDANLNLIWDNRYSSAPQAGNCLYDVIESQAGSGAGDIIAVGWTSNQARDAWVLRVDGQNGQTGSSLQGSAIYGSSMDDEARAVTELQITSPGDLVIVGHSFGRPGPSTSSEVLLIETNANPCSWVADLYAGDNGPDADGGLDVKEDLLNTTGQVIVTGYSSIGSGSMDAFLYQFASGTLAPSTIGMAYGGSGDDCGWSVNVAQNNVPGSETPGYVLAGYTRSPSLIPPTDIEEVYLIKTDLNLSSNCNETPFPFSCTQVGLSPFCPPPVIQPMGASCTPTYAFITQPWSNQLCYIYPSNREQGNGGNDGVSGVESPAVISFNEGTVTSYPNPIASGTALNLRFDLAASADVQISVSDLVGHEIYQRSEHLQSGSALHAIATDGWSAGAYLVRVTIGAKSATARVVVLGK